MKEKQKNNEKEQITYVIYHWNDDDCNDESTYHRMTLEEAISEITDDAYSYFDEENEAIKEAEEYIERLKNNESFAYCGYEYIPVFENEDLKQKASFELSGKNYNIMK